MNFDFLKMDKLTIRDVDLKGKRVLVRVDFNVPLSPSGEVTDDRRVRASLPTINYILEKGGKVILMSHLGRPDGKRNPKYSLLPTAKCLEKLINRPVKMLNDCIGKEVEYLVNLLKVGEIALLENVRFHKEEEENDAEFSRQLASLGDIYINDAFGSAHRAHASVSGVTKYLKSAAGFLLEKEIEYLEKVLYKPEKPFAAILGGAKVSDKILVLENLIKKIDILLIGGGMAYTFLKAKGQKIGNSKVEIDKIDFASKILKDANEKKVKVILPIDNVIAEKVEEDANTKVVKGDIPDGWLGLDIGPRTIEEFKNALRDAKTILWNGPLGVFEIDKFAEGTKSIAQFIAISRATTIVGGGDTASAVEKFGVADKITHVSTGGGASLEFLEGKELPGVQALTSKRL